MQIRIDDLSGPEIAAFLAAHLQDMRAVSPPESKHALDLPGLRAPDVAFWTAWDRDELVACGALKTLDPHHAELKSMRSAPAFRGRGYASQLLLHILDQARARGIRRVSLETGAMPFFEPAHQLYSKFGFKPCRPFGSYWDDPNSIFMTLEL